MAHRPPVARTTAEPAVLDPRLTPPVPVPTGDAAVKLHRSTWSLALSAACSPGTGGGGGGDEVKLTVVGSSTETAQALKTAIGK